MKKLILFLLAALMLSTTVLAQSDMESSVDKIVNQYGEAYLKGYMQPFVTAFGTASAGALYHRAYTKSFPRLDVGISAVYISIPDEAKTFAIAGGQQPTVFGPQGGLVNGTDVSDFFLPQLQLNLGLFANFEVTGRGFSVNVPDLGDISLLGFGIKYGLSDLIPIPMFPLDFSVQAMYSKFSVSDWLNSGTFGMNLQTSASVPVLPLDVYAGIGFESTSMTLDTKALSASSPFGDVSIDGENNFRMNVGASLTFLLLNVHVDYNIGKYNSLGGGVMIVF